MQRVHQSRPPHAQGHLDAPMREPSSKESVLAAAHQLILQNGYAGLSMRALAEECGLAKATIYHHFQDKRTIFLQVLARDVEQVHAAIVQAVATPGDLRARLRTVIQTIFTLQQQRHLMMLAALRELDQNEMELCQILHRYRRELCQPVIGLVQTAIDAGELRPIPAEAAVIGLIGMIQGFVTHKTAAIATGAVATGATDMPADFAAAPPVAVELVLDLFLRGIATPSLNRV